MAIFRNVRHAASRQLPWCCLGNIGSLEDDAASHRVPEPRQRFDQLCPAVVVIEACALAGWVADLCAECGLPCKVANTASEAWKFKHTKRKTDKDEINKAVKLAAANQLKGILGWTDQPNVSIDFNHDSHSSTFHMDQTKVMDGTLVRVMSWYDNEWGFSNRMADTAVAMGKLG